MTRRLILVLALVPVLALALPVRRLRLMIAVAASAVSPYLNPELLLEFEDDDFSTSGTVHDTSGNDYHLDVVVGGMGEGSRGSRKTAIFYGTNDASRTTANWNQTATNGTLNVWIRPTSTGIRQAFFGSSGATGHYLVFVYQGQDNATVARRRTVGVYSEKPGVSWLLSPAQSVVENTWNMITYRADSGTTKISINGSPVVVSVRSGSNLGAWFSTLTSTKIFLGKYAAGWVYSGDVSDLYITNEVLTDDEILELYNRTK